MSEYKVVSRTTYMIVDENGIAVDRHQYSDPERAMEGIRRLYTAEAAEAARRERQRIARNRPGTWTPASLREYLATDPHWETQDLSDGGKDTNFRGVYRLTWRDIDERQPSITRHRSDGSIWHETNYDIYGRSYIATINDEDNSSHGAQFELVDTNGLNSQAWTYATVDRLAAALIRRGIMQPPAIPKLA